jgi:NADP-dependent 3-hydroxy acid dehydrogenase YdfG
MKRVAGKVVVLTGASSGIGRVTAQLFARFGAKLVLAARSTEGLEDVRRLCLDAGAEAIAITTDVRDEAQVMALRDAAVAHFGRIDVWVNDAAVYLMGRLEDVPTAQAHEVFDTNVMGVFHGNKAALQQFRKQGTGTLITVGSVAGKAPYANASLYCASKHAVHAMNAALRQELVGTKIEACVVAPASVDTPLFDHAANYTGREMKVMPPIYRAERVARAIVRCAASPRREVLVGAAPRLFTLMSMLTPWIYERLQPRMVSRQHLGPAPAGPSSGNLERTRRPYADDAGWKDGRSSVHEPAPSEVTAGALLAPVGD